MLRIIITAMASIGTWYSMARGSVYVPSLNASVYVVGGLNGFAITWAMLAIVAVALLTFKVAKH